MADENTSTTEVKKNNGLAIAGFVVSLVSLLFVPILGIVGLILSIIGLKKVKEMNSGKGLSIAGIIISVVAIVFFIVSVILVIGIFNNANNTVNSKWEDINSKWKTLNEIDS